MIEFVVRVRRGLAVGPGEVRRRFSDERTARAWLVRHGRLPEGGDARMKRLRSLLQQVDSTRCLTLWSDDEVLDAIARCIWIGRVEVVALPRRTWVVRGSSEADDEAEARAAQDAADRARAEAAEDDGSLWTSLESESEPMGFVVELAVDLNPFEMVVGADVDDEVGGLVAGADVDDEVGGLVAGADVDDEVGGLTVGADVDDAPGGLAIDADVGR